MADDPLFKLIDVPQELREKYPFLPPKITEPEARKLLQRGGPAGYELVSSVGQSGFEEIPPQQLSQSTMRKLSEAQRMGDPAARARVESQLLQYTHYGYDLSELNLILRQTIERGGPTAARNVIGKVLPAVNEAMEYGLTREQSVQAIAESGIDLNTATQGKVLQTLRLRAFGSPDLPSGMSGEGREYTPSQWQKLSESGRALSRATAPYDLKQYGRFGMEARGHVTESPYPATQYDIKKALQATPWTVREGMIHTGLTDPSKLGKRIKQMTSPYERVQFTGAPVKEAPWRMGPTAQAPEQGQTLRTAWVFGNLLPEGQMLLSSALGRAQEAAPHTVKVKVPSGFEPQLAERGTQWRRGQGPLELFQGHTGLQLNQWDYARIRDISFTPGEEGEQGVIRAQLERGLGRGRMVAARTWATKAGAVPADLTKFAGGTFSGYQAVVSGAPRDLAGWAAQIYSALDEKTFQKITGVERPATWQEMGPELTQKLVRSLGTPQTWRVPMTLAKDQLQWMQDAGRVVGEPEALGEGRFRAPVEFSGYDLPSFFQFSREGVWEWQNPIIPKETWEAFQQNAPETFQRMLRESRGFLQSHAAISRADLASFGRGQMSGKVTPLGELGIQGIVERAQEAAGKVAGAAGLEELPFESQANLLLGQVPKEAGTLSVKAGGRQWYFPNPQHIPRVQGAIPEEEQSAYRHRFARLLRTYGEYESGVADENALKSAIARTQMAQHTVANAPGFRRGLTGLRPQSIWGGTVTASRAVHPEELYMPTRVAAQALGVRPGSERYKRFEEKFRAGEVTPPVHGFRQPTLTSDIARVAQQAKWIGNIPDEGLRGFGGVVGSPHFMAMVQGDVDTDDLAIMAAEGVDLSTAKQIKAMRQRIVGIAEDEPGQMVKRALGKISQFRSPSDITNWMRESRARISIPRARELMSERNLARTGIGGASNLRQEMMAAAPFREAREAAQRVGAVMQQEALGSKRWAEPLRKLMAFRSASLKGGGGFDWMRPAGEEGEWLGQVGDVSYGAEGLPGTLKSLARGLESEGVLDERQAASLLATSPEQVEPMMQVIRGEELVTNVASMGELAERSALGRTVIGQAAARGGRMSEAVQSQGRRLLGLRELSRTRGTPLHRTLEIMGQQGGRLGRMAAAAGYVGPRSFPGGNVEIPYVGEAPSARREGWAARMYQDIEQSFGRPPGHASTAQRVAAAGKERVTGFGGKGGGPPRRGAPSTAAPEEPGRPGGSQGPMSWQFGEEGISFNYSFGQVTPREYREAMAKSAMWLEHHAKATEGVVEGTKRLDKQLEMGNRQYKKWVDTIRRVANRWDISPKLEEQGAPERALNQLSWLRERGTLGRVESIQQMAESQQMLKRLGISRRDLSPEQLQMLGLPPGGGGGGGIGGWLRGFTPSGRGMYAGNLGQLAWGMFNMQRAWRYTGGQVQKWMQGYTGYIGGQQQAMASLGLGKGYTGLTGDVLARQAAMESLKLGLGKAGWQNWGFITQALAGGGGRPRATNLGRLITGAGPVVGGAIGLNIGSSIFSSLAPNLSGALGFGAAGLTNIGLPLVGAGLAHGAIRGWLDEDYEKGGWLEELKTLPATASALNKRLYQGAAGMYDILGMTRQQQGAEELVERFAETYEMRMRWAKGEPTPKTQAQLSFQVAEEQLMERFPQISPTQATQVLGAYGQMTGRVPGEAWDTQDITAAGRLGRLAPNIQKQILEQGAGLAQQFGTLMGSPEMASYIQRYAGMGPTERQVLTQTAEQWGALKNFGISGSTLGDLVMPTMATPNMPGATPGIARPGQLQRMRGAELWQFNRLMGGDRLAWSQMGLRGGQFPGTNYQMGPNPSLVTQGPAGMNIGTIAPIGYGMSLGQFQASYSMANQRLALAKQTGDFIGPVEGYEGFRGAGGWGANTIWGIQDAMTAEQRRYQGVQMGLQGARAAAQRRYYQQMWPLQDMSTQLSYVQGMGGVSDYGQNQYTGSFAFQQQQAGLGFGYQMANIGFSRQGLALSREQQALQQAGQARNYQWQMENLGIQYGRQLTQRGWTREDWGYERQRMGREFGWRMEDYEENIRFASGRQRKRLIKRQERDVIRYAEQRSRFQREKERQEERWRWQDEDHERQMQHLAERREREKKLNDIQKRRLDIQEQRINRQEQHAKESHQLQMRQLEERKKGYQENFELQKEQREVTRSHQEEMLELQEAAAGAAKEHAEAMQELEDRYRDVQRGQQVLLAEWQRLMVKAIIKIIEELGGEAGVIRGYLASEMGWDSQFTQNPNR